MPKYAIFKLFLQKQISVAQTVTFLRKKTAGGHAPGLKQGLYVPEMLHLTHFLLKKLKKTKKELRTRYYTRIGPQKWHESNAL